METHHHQQKDQPNITSPPPPNYSQASSNSSSSYSSPSHEFSFTISLQNPTTYNPSKNKFTNNNEEKYSKSPPNNNNNNTITNNKPLVVDLSPADEIFFHGHLLPLHLLSHLPQSPSRSSSNSMDSFTLPIRELLEEDDENHHKESGSCSTSNRSNNNNKNRENRGNRGNREEGDNNIERKGEGKSNNFAFSLLFGLKKGSKIRDKEEKEENQHNKKMNKKKKKKKMRFDVIHTLKKYLKMVQPMVLFKGKRDKFRINGKCSYSYSGNVTPRNNSNNNNNYYNNYSKKEFIRGWRGQNFSAPASMRTSPTNSGLLVSTNNNFVIPSSSDHSTMEELQAAIQAAIAHCKNSITKEEKLTS